MLRRGYAQRLHLFFHCFADIHVSQPEVTEQEQTCREFCDVRMPNLSVVLRKGESVKSPNNSCLMFECNVSMRCSRVMRTRMYAGRAALIILLPFSLQGMNDIQIKVIACDPPPVCPDGYAPYKLPNSCCPGCGKCGGSGCRPSPQLKCACNIRVGFHAVSVAKIARLPCRLSQSEQVYR